MELVQLRTFLAVVEHRGFRRAARRLYLSQSAVSRQVAELERAVGVALLERTRDGAEVTAAGLVLAEQARVLLDDHEEAVRRARRDRLAGRLVLGIGPVGVGELTAPLIRHLARALPGLRLHTYELTMLAWPDAIPLETDLLLTRDPFDADRLRTTVLLVEPAVVAIPPSFPEHRATQLSLDECLGLPYARISRRVPAPFLRFWTLDDHRGGQRAHFRGRPSTHASEAPRAVARGDGIAMGTELLARYYGCPSGTMTPVVGAPRVRTVLASAVDDRRPLVDAVHREVAWITRRLGPLVLPELAEPLVV